MVLMLVSSATAKLESLRQMFMTSNQVWTFKLTQDKAGRLDYSESLMTHAMVLTGVDLDENGKSTKVEG